MNPASNIGRLILHLVSRYTYLMDTRVLALGDLLCATTANDKVEARNRLLQAICPHETALYLQRKPIIESLIRRYKELTSGKALRDKEN